MMHSRVCRNLVTFRKLYYDSQDKRTYSFLSKARRFLLKNSSKALASLTLRENHNEAEEKANDTLNDESYLNSLMSSVLPNDAVMAKEAIKLLRPLDNQVYIDMTFGAGGHTRKILNSARNVKVFALDRDPVAHAEAMKFAGLFRGQIHPLLGCFSNLDYLLSAFNVQPGTVDGILFDTGCSSLQMDDPNRGFSLSGNGPLDMRMDGNRLFGQPTVNDIIHYIDEGDLARIFKNYGLEKRSKAIAQAVVEARHLYERITTIGELAELVACSIDGKHMKHEDFTRKVYAARKVFHSLRVFANNELNELAYGLKLARKYLKPRGRLVTITYHSLEESIVRKQLLDYDLDEEFNAELAMRFKSHGAWTDLNVLGDMKTKPWDVITKKALIASSEEVERNPRAQSARLRAAYKKNVPGDGAAASEISRTTRSQQTVSAATATSGTSTSQDVQHKSTMTEKQKQQQQLQQQQQYMSSSGGLSRGTKYSSVSSSRMTDHQEPLRDTSEYVSTSAIREMALNEDKNYAQTRSEMEKSATSNSYSHHMTSSHRDYDAESDGHGYVGRAMSVARSIDETTIHPAVKDDDDVRFYSSFNNRHYVRSEDADLDEKEDAVAADKSTSHIILPATKIFYQQDSDIASEASFRSGDMRLAETSREEESREDGRGGHYKKSSYYSYHEEKVEIDGCEYDESQT